MGTERRIARALEIAHSIKTAVRSVGETLRCSIGLAPNRYLAKIASDMQKHMTLAHRKGTLLTDGLWGLVRNPNYLGELLIYARRLKVPLSAGLRAHSPDDWLELRAGGYAEYRERCRQALTARDIAVEDL